MLVMILVLVQARVGPRPASPPGGLLARRGFPWEGPPGLAAGAEPDQTGQDLAQPAPHPSVPRAAGLLPFSQTGQPPLFFCRFPFHDLGPASACVATGLRHAADEYAQLLKDFIEQLMDGRSAV